MVVEPTPEPRVPHRRHFVHPLLSTIPLLAFVVAAYVVLAALGVDFSLSRFAVQMPSGGTWNISFGDILLAAALLLLFLEVLKSTRTGGSSVVDHALSMMVFIVCIILFLVWDRAATSVFFLITLTALIDVIAGFSVTIRAARRDYSFGADA
jgi:hypothetical protein